MKRKMRLLTMLLMLLVVVTAQACPVGVQQALSTAQQFVRGQVAAGCLRAPAASATLRLAHAEPSAAVADAADYYVFTSAGGGFAIVAGDDRAAAILAYGDASFDVNDAPDGWQFFAELYKEQMEFLLSHPEAQEDPAAAPRVKSAIAPLLSTAWNQDAPYNNQCPLIDDVRCVTGCGATSLSMVFHYWRWPQGEFSGVDAYSWRDGNNVYAADALPAITFDWDNMLDSYNGSYTDEQADAVAWLMRYVGQAEKMSYGTGSSGIGTRSVMEALRTMDYDADAFEAHKTSYWGSGGYTDDEWAELLLVELESGRPLEYCAFTAGWSGHAFNVDGYDGEGGWHVNFGWGGSGNGYYRLNAFSYSGNTFNTGQIAFTGVQPPLGAFGPELRPSVARVSLSSLVGETVTATFTLKAADITGDVTLTLNDGTGLYTVSPTQISLEQAQQGATVTVTFTPETFGEFDANVKLSTAGLDDVVVNLYGTGHIEKYDPVLLDATDVSVAQGSFVANWNDSTPAQNVVSYTLEVAPQPFNELVLTETFDRDTTGVSTSDRASQLDDITATPGWTGSKVYGGNGYLRLGSASAKGWLQTPSVDVSSGKGLVSVLLRAAAVTADGGARLTVACGDADTVLTLTTDQADYAVLLPCSAADDSVQLRFSNSIKGKRAMLYGIEVYAGDATPIDSATVLFFDGITSRSHQLTGLEPGDYWLRVLARYADGTTSQWSNRVLVSLEWSQGDVNRDGEVTIADVNMLVDIILGAEVDADVLEVADVNGDGEVTIADVNAVIDMILG